MLLLCFYLNKNNNINNNFCNTFHVNIYSKCFLFLKHQNEASYECFQLLRTKLFDKFRLVKEAIVMRLKISRITVFKGIKLSKTYKE